ncbi:MAG: NUDIX domain-containing protein [Candidatus Woesearchaeota archaeon]
MGIPGGRLEYNEMDPHQALKREVKEEIGIPINIINPIDVHIWSIEGQHLRYGVFFICELCDDVTKIILSKEHEKIQWFTYNQLMQHYMQFPNIAKPGIQIINKLQKKNYYNLYY